MRREAKSTGIELMVQTFSNWPRFCLNYTATPLAFLLHPPLELTMWLVRGGTQGFMYVLAGTRSSSGEPRQLRCPPFGG